MKQATKDALEGLRQLTNIASNHAPDAAYNWIQETSIAIRAALQKDPSESIDGLRKEIKELEENPLYLVDEEGTHDISKMRQEILKLREEKTALQKDEKQQTTPVYWTYIDWDGKWYDHDFNTREEAQEQADTDFYEKCQDDRQNGYPAEKREEAITLIKYAYDEHLEKVVLETIKDGVEWNNN
ncbi:hypothetical protein KAR91_59965 [Candidatus Pacearchaeota archaeon]|nr:hypothetical protein [Candidatus Pacearchaeota archaeon]